MRYLSDMGYWQWFGLALVLFGLEFLVAASGFLLWLAFAAGVVGLLLVFLPLIPWPHQVLIFSLTGVIGSVLWWSFLLRYKKPLKSSSTAEDHIGNTYVLEWPIIDGKGSIYIENTRWGIEGPDLPQGTTIKVVGTEGNVLQVEEQA